MLSVSLRVGRCARRGAASLVATDVENIVRKQTGHFGQNSADNLGRNTLWVVLDLIPAALQAFAGQSPAEATWGVSMVP